MVNRYVQINSIIIMIMIVLRFNLCPNLYNRNKIPQYRKRKKDVFSAVAIQALSIKPKIINIKRYRVLISSLG